MPSTCQQCAAGLEPGTAYCVACGFSIPGTEPGPAAAQTATRIFLTPPAGPGMVAQPSPPSSRNPKTPMIVGAFAAVAVLAIAIAVGVTSFKPSVKSLGSGTSPSSSAKATDAQPYQGSTQAPSRTSADVPDDEATAHALLQRQVEQDRPPVEALAGSWLPQLSAKKPGLDVHGVTYDYRKTWADFVTNRQQHPGALLLLSGDFAAFRYGDFWITVAPEAFSDGAAANAWCDSAGIGKDDCYAKKLSHTGGYAGTTLLRK